MSRIACRGQGLVLIVAVSAVVFLPVANANPGSLQVDDDGTIPVPAVTLPESVFLSKESRAALKAARERAKLRAEKGRPCPSMQTAERGQVSAIRRCEAEAYYKSDAYLSLRDRYGVTLTTQRIGGVHTEVFAPSEGIAPKNQKRVLINLHGGGFRGGARTISHIESIPIASLGKIKVISIDYRQAPEYTFPAASEDVAAVYREVIKTYEPASVGIYGCSAGGLLTAQSVMWLAKEGLPRPGAVGMFCAGAAWNEGDSAYLPANVSRQTSLENPYFKDTDSNNPLTFPLRSPDAMAKFPPSLLIASTRDQALSSVVRTHSVLVARGVDADLHVWEGLGHAFYFDPALPESQEVFDVIVKFFDRHLQVP